MLPMVITDEQWNPGWGDGQSLPAGTQRESIARRFAKLKAACKPLGEDEEVMAVLAEPIFFFGRTYNVKYDAAGVISFCIDALAQYPAWAIEEAIKRCMIDWDNHFQLPMPKEIAAHIPDALRDVQSEFKRMEAALRAFDKGDIRPDDDEMATAEDWAMLEAACKSGRDEDSGNLLARFRGPGR